MARLFGAKKQPRVESRVLGDSSVAARVGGDLDIRGYSVVKLLDSVAVAGLLNDLPILRASRSIAKTDHAGNGFEFHASPLDPDVHYRREALRIVKSYLYQPVVALVGPHTVHSGGCFIKLPLSGLVSLHQDWTITDGARALNVWCPLVDVDDRNGGLRVVEGSHRLFPNISAPAIPPYFHAYSDTLRKRSRLLELTAGEAVIFDSTLLHWSKANSSRHMRPVAAFNCVPFGAAQLFYRATANGAGFQVFDMSGDRFTEHSALDLFGGELRAPSLGFIDDPNRPVSLARFEDARSTRLGASLSLS